MSPEVSHSAILDAEEARALEKLLAEARRALEFGRSHVVVIGDSRTTPILIRSMEEELRSELETVVVTLGDRDPDSARAQVDAAIRDARSAAATEGPAQLALLLPDALAIPTASLRALDAPGAPGPARRLVLFVDRDATDVEDPARELVARLGVGMSKIELEPARRPLVREPAPERAQAAPGEGAAPPGPPELRAPLEPLGPPQVSAPRRRRVRPIAVRSRGRSTGVRPSLRWAAVVVLAGAGLFTFAPGIVHQAPAEPEAVAVTTHEAATPTAAPSEPEPTAPEKQVQPAPTSAKPLPPVGVPRREPAHAVAKADSADGEEPPAERAPPTSRELASAPEPADAKPAPIRIGVNFNARPWAELEVDGRSLGATPVADVRLAPGEHTVVATFPDGRVSRRTVRVDALQNRFRID